MPRFVRPAWLEASADGRASPIGLGPRDRAGWLWARVTMRTPDGSVSDAVTLSAGGMDSTGRGRLELDIPPALEVIVEPPGTLTGRTAILIRPRVEA